MDYKMLGYEIVRQAIDDYRMLREMKRTRYATIAGGIISKREIESFLCSKWCEVLLSDFGMSGRDILKVLKAEDVREV
jgi:hypothetical protein